MIVRKAFVYRLYPTRAQAAALETVLHRCRELYNAGLEERREAYRMTKVSLGGAAQQAQLPGVKKIRPEYAALDAQLLQDVLQRLDRAFAAFFRRIQNGVGKAGFPRFKSRDRYDSFTFKQTGWKLADGRLGLRGIGALKVRWSRPIGGTIKTVTIRRDAEAWFVSFSCVIEAPDPTPDSSLRAVGLDVGIEHFASLSDGTHIANPRHLRAGTATLTRRQQALARKLRGSRRRKKAKLLVAKAHRRIRNQRKDFHHQTARALVRIHGLIAVEAIQIANLVRRPAPILGVTAAEGTQVSLPNGAAAKAGLNKSINDAGWGAFLAILSSKAAEAGCAVIAVNPAGTSQTCSGCGRRCPKDLSVRWHVCPHCGCSLQRDVNAARNILARVGKTRQASRA
ncbi:MAG TPA: transposase [Chloroflexota bacterium]|nr:transposase [Chloroflexota bacterium]